MALLALTALFLFPYLFLGRSMLPLELMAIFQPWARHARELWGEVPLAHNPLLDSLQQYYPRRVYMQEALGEGWLPLWHPYSYGGAPFHATQQGAVLYPPAWLLALLPAELQFGWSALLHLFVAGWGAWLFFRQVGLRPAGALVGAVAFAFNGYVVVWLAYPNVTQWTLCWLPLALYFWERGRETDDLRWIAASAAALALNLLGGHGQSSAYVLMVWGTWALLRSLGSPKRLLAIGRWVVLPGALAVGLALGHLLPVLEFVPRTDRGARVVWSSVVQAGMPLAQLWTFLLPRLFGDATVNFGQQSWLPHGDKAGLAFVERTFYPGISVLALAAAAWGAVRLPKTHRHLALFSLGVTLLGVLLAMATPLYWPLWRAAPGFGNFTAVARIVCVCAWGLAALAAVGTHALLAEEDAVRVPARAALTGGAVLLALLAGIGQFVFGGAAPPGVVAFLQQTGRPSADALAARDFALALGWVGVPVAIAWGMARLRPGGRISPAVLAGVLLAGVVAADLFSFGAGFNPRSDPRLLHGKTPELQAVTGVEEPFRFLSAGPPGQEMELKQRMPSNLAATYGLADINGSDSFVTLRYRAWEAALLRQSGGGHPFSRPGAPNLRSAAVRYYLTGSRDVLPGLRAVTGAALQEDPQALPYARFHASVRSFPTGEELLRALEDPARDPSIALTDAPGIPPSTMGGSVVPFSLLRPNGNRLVLEGEAPSAGLLVVAEQHDPGWRATVDGRPVRIVPADHLFTGIPLEPGRHRVELVYAPGTVRTGLFITALALAALITLLIAARPAAPRDT